jgi:hypothetical protein
MMIEDAHVVVGADWNGISVLVGVLITGIVTIGNAIQNWRSSKKVEDNKKEAIAARNAQNVKLDKVSTLVDGHATEQTRQITALHEEVARLQTPGTITPTQIAGQGDAPVGIDRGIVTVEPVTKTTEGKPQT